MFIDKTIKKKRKKDEKQISNQYCYIILIRDSDGGKIIWEQK